MSNAIEPPQPSVVVLVAEDDTLVRMMAAYVLTDAGFDVVEAGHADDALGILNAQARTIKALFTDIHMPGELDGLHLAHHVRNNWPWIALLVTSGRARPAPEEMPIGSRFLQKPYHPDRVVHHVRELVGAN